MKEFKTWTIEDKTVEKLKEYLKTYDVYDLIQGGYFKNSLPYPGLHDLGDLIKICEHCGSKYEDQEVKAKIKEGRDAYRKEDTTMYILFRESLFISNNLEHNTKTDKAFSIAWDKGHANGYSEVYHEFLSLLPLIS